MAAIAILIAFSLILATGFLIAFYWAVKDGQYEDDVTPSVRILYDGSQSPPQESTSFTTQDS